MFKAKWGLGIGAAFLLTGSFLAGQPPAPGNDNVGRQRQPPPPDRSWGFSGSPDRDGHSGGYDRGRRAVDDNLDDGPPIRNGRPGAAAIGGAGGRFGPGSAGAGFGLPGMGGGFGGPGRGFGPGRGPGLGDRTWPGRGNFYTGRAMQNRNRWRGRVGPLQAANGPGRGPGLGRYPWPGRGGFGPRRGPAFNGPHRFYSPGGFAMPRMRAGRGGQPFRFDGPVGARFFGQRRGGPPWSGNGPRGGGRFGPRGFGGSFGPNRAFARAGQGAPPGFGRRPFRFPGWDGRYGTDGRRARGANDAWQGPWGPWAGNRRPW
jgi:hypothetical protein